MAELIFIRHSAMVENLTQMAAWRNCFIRHSDMVENLTQMAE